MRWASASTMQHCSVLNAYPLAHCCSAKQTASTLALLHVHLCVFAIYKPLVGTLLFQHRMHGSVQLCKTDRQHPCVTSCTPKHICIRYKLTVGKGNALQQLLKAECNGLWLSAAPQNRQTAPLWHCMYTYACLPNIKAYSLQRFLRCSTCLTLNAMACGPMLSCKTV